MKTRKAKKKKREKAEKEKTVYMQTFQSFILVLHFTASRSEGGIGRDGVYHGIAGGAD